MTIKPYYLTNLLFNKLLFTKVLFTKVLSY